MSEIKKSKPKAIKAPTEPKTRGKKQMSKEECLKLLVGDMNELKQEIQNLKDDQSKLPNGMYKILPDLINDEIEDLVEELQEIEQKHNELSQVPSIAEEK